MTLLGFTFEAFFGAQEGPAADGGGRFSLVTVVAIIMLPFFTIFVLPFLDFVFCCVTGTSGVSAAVSDSTEFCVYNFFFLDDFAA